ncbi:MAG: hypothetical protein ACI97A_004173 [Planctomycetota bacterium]|jgi:hypothetical protein
MKHRILPSIFFVMFLFSSFGLAQTSPEVLINEANFEEWLAFIRPTKSELSFERVGWRGEFWPAVKEARMLGRPILLWTMNGHPLGCT